MRVVDALGADQLGGVAELGAGLVQEAEDLLGPPEGLVLVGDGAGDAEGAEGGVDVIHRLRELDVPLPEVQRILRSPDPGVRATLLAHHLQRLESELDRTRAAVASLRRLLQPEPAPLDVELRAVPATTVAAVEDLVEHDHVIAWYAGAMAELEAVVGTTVAGVPGGLYDNSLFESGRGHVLVYLPVAEPSATGRVHPSTLPAVELAVTTHSGEHDDIDVTYGELGAWVVANALSVAGPVREHYVIGPGDTRDPTAWRTEIGWPVFRMAH